MIGKRFLAAILLGVILCFVVSGVGYGEIRAELMGPPTRLDFLLLQSQFIYVMAFPDNFESILLSYDPDGKLGKEKELPEGVDTKGKIVASIVDSRYRFSGLEADILRTIKRELEVIYTYGAMIAIAPDMNTDIVAVFYSYKSIPLAYFYQGEYHLWDE